jgi:hypothetical protein
MHTWLERIFSDTSPNSPTLQRETKTVIAFTRMLISDNSLLLGGVSWTDKLMVGIPLATCIR